MSMKIKGINRTIKSKLTDVKAAEDADRLSYESIMRYGRRASERAPVDTGLLSSSMISGIHKDSSSDFPKYTQYERTDYTMVQEFTHAKQDRFIRDSLIEERPKFLRSVQVRYKRGRRS